MKTIELQINSDYLQRLASSSSPLLSIIELIWNSLDADATEVEVVFTRHEIGGIDGVKVIDNGNGFTPIEAEKAFQNLGGSHKLNKTKTSSGRILHGRKGEGRLRAFRLGNYVKWTTRYRNGNETLEYHITGHKNNLKCFSISNFSVVDASPGTIVKVDEIVNPLLNLESNKTAPIQI
jgi:hypothetical protein